MLHLNCTALSQSSDFFMYIINGAFLIFKALGLAHRQSRDNQIFLEWSGLQDFWKHGWSLLRRSSGIKRFILYYSGTVAELPFIIIF